MAFQNNNRVRQLNDLDRVLDFLERMNLHHRTEVPTPVTDLLIASGLPSISGERPMTLMPRVLNLQQQLRRQLASEHRTAARITHSAVVSPDPPA